jgi:hypothetical protein
LQNVRAVAIGPRSIFAKQLPHVKTAGEKESYRAVKMAADDSVQFHVWLADAEIQATMWSLGEPDHVLNQFERAIYGITSQGQIWLTQEFSIFLVKVEA